MGLKEIFANRKLTRIAAAIRRSPEIPSLDAIKKVGVIWQPDQKEAFFFLQDYFSKKQVIFRSICVFNENSGQQPGSAALIPKDLDWLGFPKPGKIDVFTEIHFDLLLNIALRKNVTLDFITLVTEAKFKSGTSVSDQNYFDLNIKIGQNQDAMYLAKQQIFYLGQLNKKESS
jgi:hypothetical protein